MRFITNHVPRFTIDAYELTSAEREDFDYLAWGKIDAGEDSATFFRYRGQLYDLSEFVRSTDPDNDYWDGIATDSFFSATVVKIMDDGESVIVGRMYS
jgi:hypothetical protein